MKPRNALSLKEDDTPEFFALSPSLDALLHPAAQFQFPGEDIEIPGMTSIFSSPLNGLLDTPTHASVTSDFAALVKNLMTADAATDAA